MPAFFRVVRRALVTIVAVSHPKAINFLLKYQYTRSALTTLNVSTTLLPFIHFAVHFDPVCPAIEDGKSALEFNVAGGIRTGALISPVFYRDIGASDFLWSLTDIIAFVTLLVSVYHRYACRWHLHH